jgi:hypothetical protein
MLLALTLGMGVSLCGPDFLPTIRHYFPAAVECSNQSRGLEPALSEVEGMPAPH